MAPKSRRETSCGVLPPLAYFRPFKYLMALATSTLSCTHTPTTTVRDRSLCSIPFMKLYRMIMWLLLDVVLWCCDLGEDITWKLFGVG